MRIDIKYTNLNSTPAIIEYVEAKIGSLEKFLKKIEAEAVVEAAVELARTTKHHHKGSIFRAECNLRIPGGMIRAEHEDWDIRVAVDKLKDNLRVQIKKYLEKNRP